MLRDMRLCRTCERPTDQDDDGACFGRGHLCPTCGFYRTEIKRQKKTSKLTRRESDMLLGATPADPGIELPEL